MSFSDTVANDFKITDSAVSATFTAKRAGGNTAYPVAFADPSAFTSQEIVASGGFYQAGDKRWVIGRNQIPGVTPQSGDEVLDPNGVTWELIANATLDDFSVSWDCPTRKAR